MKIAFVMDSPGDLLPEQAQAFDIHIAPVTITVDSVTRRDYYDVERTAFWKELYTHEDIPTTAQITPDQWISLFAQKSAEGYTHMIVLLLSSTATGTYGSACAAREIYGADHPAGLVIEILDSRNYSIIYGRLMPMAAQMAADGASFAETVSFLRTELAKAQALLWVYSLHHLKKSGRITGMAAFVGETLGLRPILWIRDGVISPIERVRGDKNIVPRMARLALEYAEKPEEQDMILLYADVPEEEIARAEAAVRKTLRPRSLTRHPIGAVIAINTGPQAMALVFNGRPQVSS